MPAAKYLEVLDTQPCMTDLLFRWTATHTRNQRLCACTYTQICLQIHMYALRCALFTTSGEIPWTARSLVQTHAQDQHLMMSDSASAWSLLAQP
jgi:hypothetical protein